MTGEEHLPPLAERYGRGPTRRGRRHAVIAGCALAAAITGWAAWVGLSVADQPVRWTDESVDVQSDTRTDVTFLVTLRPGLTAVCTVHAINRELTEVGLIDITVNRPASGSATVTAHVPTSERAQSGGVKSCIAR